MFDVLIKDGLIVDGTGGPSYLGDILIKDGRIIKIDKNICAEALEVVEAAGLVVAPGFIDVHSHNDLVPFMDENKKRAIKYGNSVCRLG